MTRRAGWLLGALVLLLLAAWQIRPVLIWHLVVEPELRDSPAERRAYTPTESGFPAPPEGWTGLLAGRLSLRAPLEAGGDACRRCARMGCTLPLERGKLTVFDGPPAPPSQEALDWLAPDARDFSVFRSRRRNWTSLHALVHRTRTQTPPVETFRFRAARSRGIVSRFANGGVERFVVYAYDEGGAAAPVVALSDAGRETLRRVLGSLRVLARAEPGRSRCAD